MIIAEAWEKLHSIYKKASTPPKTHKLDNKISKDLVDSFDQEHIQYQLVTPYKHHNN